MGDSDADTDAVIAFFEGRPEARTLYDALLAAAAHLGPVQVRVTKSQVALVLRRAFTWVWTPDRYLRGATAPLVLSIMLPRHDNSHRWKQVVEVRPGRWMHHLELRDTREVDAQVSAWLAEAVATQG